MGKKIKKLGITGFIITGPIICLCVECRQIVEEFMSPTATAFVAPIFMVGNGIGNAPPLLHF